MLTFELHRTEGLARRLEQEGGLERFRLEGDLPATLGRLVANVV